MTNQNRKSKVRARMAVTGRKYTEAAREIEVREGLASEIPDSPLLQTVRKSCDECGGPIRWVRVSELERLRPGGYTGFANAYGEEELHPSAWVCLQCENFGVFGAEQFGGDWSGLVSGDSCPDCDGELEWVDPASVAARDREVYLDAKRRYGAASLLDGEASVCSGCSRTEFYPAT